MTVTLHRRENWPQLPALAGMLAGLAAKHQEITFVYPVHLNPVVNDAVRPVLKGIPNVVLNPPLAYGEMAALLGRSLLIVTDSGGLQEEGPALGVPVVVLRKTTERPEGVASGVLKLAGTDPDVAFAMIDALLSNPAARDAMRGARNPYGDGRASERIAAGVAWRLGLAPRPVDWTG